MDFKKKNIILLLILAMLMLTLIACDTNDTGPAPTISIPEQTSGVTASETPTKSPLEDAISDLNIGEAELYEPIEPLEFEDGEEIDNLYYKRTVDGNGEPAYMVINATTKQAAYLPLGQTVIYAGEYETCFYERFNVTYKQNDEFRSTVQYQLHVNAAVVPAATDVPVQETEPIE